METLTTGLPTKSAKIRILWNAGYTRQQIADFLGIRYQHVRNVLVQAPSYREGSVLRAPREPTIAEAGPISPASHEVGPAGSSPKSGSLVVDMQGRITLPPALLAALDAIPGRPIPWRFEAGELKLMSVEAGIRFLRRLLRPYLSRVSVQELLSERRREAKLEDAGDRR